MYQEKRGRQRIWIQGLSRPSIYCHWHWVQVLLGEYWKVYYFG